MWGQEGDVNKAAAAKPCIVFASQLFHSQAYEILLLNNCNVLIFNKMEEELSLRSFPVKSSVKQHRKGNFRMEPPLSHQEC